VQLNPFVKFRKVRNERQRRDGFTEAIRSAGFDTKVLQVPMHERAGADNAIHYTPDLKNLVRGLREMTKPLGVFTSDSVIARSILEIAQNEGFLVPDEIAVLGVNDDPLVCESTSPPLSAVMQASEKIGLEAAHLLDRLMRGEEKKPREIRLPPVGVLARRSTDMLAVEDQLVATAICFIREHAHLPIEVVDIVEKADVSRRTLENRFVKAIGRTPGAEIRRIRLERAKRLLTETSDPITNIVYAAGFNSRQVFSSVFRCETGMTPSAYRNQFAIDVFPTGP